MFSKHFSFLILLTSFFIFAFYFNHVLASQAPAKKPNYTLPQLMDIVFNSKDAPTEVPKKIEEKDKNKNANNKPIDNQSINDINDPLNPDNPKNTPSQALKEINDKVIQLQNQQANGNCVPTVTTGCPLSAEEIEANRQKAQELAVQQQKPEQQSQQPQMPQLPSGAEPPKSPEGDKGSPGQPSSSPGKPSPQTQQAAQGDEITDDKEGNTKSCPRERGNKKGECKTIPKTEVATNNKGINLTSNEQDLGEKGFKYTHLEFEKSPVAGRVLGKRTKMVICGKETCEDVVSPVRVAETAVEPKGKFTSVPGIGV